MTTPATYAARPALPAAAASALLASAVLVAFVALSLPLLRADGGPLTSDESLYAAEGLNLAEGKGFTYPSGEPVQHRGPVFPVLLAADFAVAGFSIDNAVWVPKLFALGSALLLLLLARRFFGRETALLSAGLGLVSALPLLIGSSLFLDGVQTFFLLLVLLFLHVAVKDERPGFGWLAGGALGLAVLTKESALLWLPLPFLIVLLLGPAVRRPERFLGTFAGGFIAVAGWWWPYVFAVTGEVYLLGDPGRAVVWAAAAGVCLAIAAVAAHTAAERGASIRLRQPARWALAGVFVLGWGAFVLAGLERHSTWPFPADYLTNVPDYTVDVLASWLRPLPVIAAAWGYTGYRAWRGSLGDRLLILGLLLFLPFALFVANRGLHVRDVLPLVYLSYLALARATVDLARWLAETAGESVAPAFASGAAALLVLAAFAWLALDGTQRFSDYRATFDAGAVEQNNWDNPLAREAAAWMDEHLPPGVPVMSGRLYYSQLYALTGARNPWWQLPTVRVDLTGAPATIERASTLFRWEDGDMPKSDGASWMYLHRYPEKGYYVAISERDLLAALREHQIGYLVLTGDDAGFSSLSLLPYFQDHPAFEEVESFVADASNQVHVFRVTPAALELTSPPLRVSGETAAELSRALGAKTAHDFLVSLSPGGYVITGAAGAAAQGEP